MATRRNDLASSIMVLHTSQQPAGTSGGLFGHGSSRELQHAGPGLRNSSAKQLGRQMIFDTLVYLACLPWANT